MAKQKWKPTVVDGAIMGDEAGGQWRTFNPPWWRVDRWAQWWVGRLGEACERALKVLEYGTALQLPEPTRATRGIVFRNSACELVEVRVRVEQVRRPRYNVVASSIRRL